MLCGGHVYDLFVANRPLPSPQTPISYLIQCPRQRDQVFCGLQERQQRGEQGRGAGGPVRGRRVHREHRLISCMSLPLA